MAWLVCAYVCLANQCKASPKKSAVNCSNCCNRCSGRGTVVLEWGPLKRLQRPTVESQLCAPRGAVCWNDPCKSIRSVFGLQRWSIFTHAHGCQLTSLLRIKEMPNRNARIYLYVCIMSAVHLYYSYMVSRFCYRCSFYHTFNVK